MNSWDVILRATLALGSLSPVSAQSLTPPAVYDVSSVKPHDPSDPSMSWHSDNDGFRVLNADLKSVISSAWDLRPDQITGQPAWADELHWDITGKSTELTADQLKRFKPEQRNEMMQQLLRDRFRLTAHLESRTGPIYTLVPAKGGVKLSPIAMTEEQRAAGKVLGSSLRMMMDGKTVIIEAKHVSLALLLKHLAHNLHRTIIDKSDLPDDSVFDFTLRWISEDEMGSAAETDAPPLPSALEEQLGLHLESSKGPVQVLVVDSVEQPTAN